MKIKNNIRKQTLFAGLAFAFIALCLGLWARHNLQPPFKEIPLKSGTAFPIPREIKPFELKNAPTGSPFTPAQLKGHWTFLFFGFTHCAMLCPTTLSTLNQFYSNLTAESFREKPNITFISIDPSRDPLERIHQYVTSFNKNFLGATGTESQLDQMTQELNILYAKVNPEDKDYQIDHSGTVLVINPNGQLAALFSPPIDAKALTEDFKALVENYLKKGSHP